MVPEDHVLQTQFRTHLEREILVDSSPEQLQSIALPDPTLSFNNATDSCMGVQN